MAIPEVSEDQARFHKRPGQRHEPAAKKSRGVAADPACPVLSVAEAAEALRAGEVVAFPTETVFGLGADARNGDAVSKIYTAKGRPSDNPLIVHVGSMEQITFVQPMSATTRIIGEKFWPGPLSIVFQHKAGICDRVRAGLDSVAVRIPSHPVARELLKVADIPVAAPSANISGKPSPTCTAHVTKDFGSRIRGVVSGESCDMGVESTVIKVDELPAGPKITILRPGNITKDMLEAVVGEGNVILDAHLISTDAQPLAPGMKYRHYAPDAPLMCVTGSDLFFKSTVERGLGEHKRVGVMITKENGFKAFFESHQNVRVLCIGSRSNVEDMCKNLFHCLRSFNDGDVTQIFSETVAAEGVGFAFMNRLLKAASNQVLHE